MAEIFEYVCKLGENQKHAVYEALRNAYEPKAFEKSEARGLPKTMEVRAHIEECEASKLTRNLVSRTCPLPDFGLYKEDVEAGWDLLEVISGGLVFDVQDRRLETLRS